jgi:hypothetical protein
MKLRTIFKATVALAPIALIVGVSWNGLKEYYSYTPNKSDITTPTTDIEPTPPPRMTVEPPTVKNNNITDIKYNLSDYAENIPDDKREFFDLSLKIEEITGIDAYIIFAKLAMETRFDRAFVDRSNHGIKGARGLFQQELANIVTGIRVHGDSLTTVNALPEDNDLRLAVANHGRAMHLKQMPFYQTLDANDPLKIALDSGWSDSDGDRKNDLDLSTSPGYNNLDDIYKTMVQEWDEYTRISDGTLVKFIAEQAENNNFITSYDQAIYSIPLNDVIAGELAARDALHTTPSAHQNNFTETWEQDLETRNTAFLAVYSTHNMGKNGARIQMAIATNPEWALVKPRYTEHMHSIINEVSSALGIRAISPETLSLRANRNQAVFQEGSATRYGCLSYNISSEVNAHVGSFLPVIVDYGSQQQWYEGHCGRDPLASHRPKMRPTQEISIVESDVAPKTSLRPRMRPATVELAQNKP